MVPAVINREQVHNQEAVHRLKPEQQPVAAAVRVVHGAIVVGRTVVLAPAQLLGVHVQAQLLGVAVPK